MIDLYRTRIETLHHHFKHRFKFDQPLFDLHNIIEKGDDNHIQKHRQPVSDDFS